MKNNTARVLRSPQTKNGFTLIELMVVVTIMAIIGTVLVTPFKMLFDGMSTRDRGQYIADMIRSLDESIEENQAESYEAVFESGSIGFVTNQDWYKKSPVITGTFDFETGTGMLKSIGTGTGVWITANNTGREESIPENGGTYIFSFPRGDNDERPYTISNTLDDISNSPLNSFLIRYYDLPDTTDIAENPTRLVSITSPTGTGYTALTMENVRGQRIITGSGATRDVLAGVKLVFEKGGMEIPVVIGETGQ